MEFQVETWSYQPAPDIDKPVAARLRDVPRDPGMLVYAARTIVQLTIRGLLHTYNRFEVVGREHLPADASFVMVCNHTSHLDAVCLLSSLPIARVHAAFPAAAADYFFSSVPRSLFSAVAINGVPFDRTRHSRESLEICRRLLAERGNVLILFPEGTRSATGEPGRFRSGIARLVAGTPTPVVPCYLAGAYDAWPKGTMLPRPRPLQLRIGRPRLFLDTAPHDREAAAAICEQLRADVLALGRNSSVGSLRLQADLAKSGYSSSTRLNAISTPPRNGTGCRAN